METEIPGSILTGGNILLLNFWVLHSKASDANIGIIADVVCFSKTRTNESSNTVKYRARTVTTRFHSYLMKRLALVTALGPGRDGLW